MQIECFIFDLDGTLINSIADLTLACNSVLARYGFSPIDETKCKLLAGYGFRELIILASTSSDSALIDRMTQELYKEYEKQNDANTIIYDGILHALNEPVLKNTKKAILSNKPDYLTQRCIKKIFGNMFDEVFGHMDGYQKKPNPQSALELAKKFNLAPSQMLIIGDTKTDIQTAKNANMLSCGVTWGYRDRQELSDNGADFIANNTEDLIKILNGISK